MTPRVAVLTDFPDEGWPSMDLCGDMLLAHLPDSVQGVRVCPPFRRAATRLPVLGRRRAALNADRLLNRFVVFPRAARRAAGRFDLFHVADHSYAHLALALPAARTGVYCHDLDAFRCLLDPAADPRPRWFRALARRTLAGLQRAAVVFHSTAAVRDAIVRAGLVEEGRLVHAPYGVSDEFTPAAADRPALPWLDALGDRPWVLHVGSCAPRKRIDVLLDVTAAVRGRLPDVRLVKVGGEWSAADRARLARHGLGDTVVHVHNLSRPELAEVYRRAGVVVVTSEAEGFGLPVVEALACGAAVVASDLAPLREAGGPAAAYAPVGDVPAWAELVATALAGGGPPRADRVGWAARYSWPAHAATIAAAYLRLTG